MELRLVGLRCLGAAAMPLFLLRAVCGRTTMRTPDIFPLQPDAAQFVRRWQVSKARLVTDVDHALAFLFAQLVRRYRSRRPSVLHRL